MKSSNEWNRVVSAFFDLSTEHLGRRIRDATYQNLSIGRLLVRVHGSGFGTAGEMVVVIEDEGVRRCCPHVQNAAERPHD